MGIDIYINNTTPSRAKTANFYTLNFTMSQEDTQEIPQMALPGEDQAMPQMALPGQEMPQMDLPEDKKSSSSSSNSDTSSDSDSHSDDDEDKKKKKLRKKAKKSEKGG